MAQSQSSVDSARNKTDKDVCITSTTILILTVTYQLVQRSALRAMRTRCKNFGVNEVVMVHTGYLRLKKLFLEFQRAGPIVV